MNKLDQISREVDDNWPKHADGRGKRFGEMTEAEKNVVRALMWNLACDLPLQPPTSEV